MEFLTVANHKGTYCFPNILTEFEWTLTNIKKKNNNNKQLKQQYISNSITDFSYVGWGKKTGVINVTVEIFVTHDSKELQYMENCNSKQTRSQSKMTNLL